MSRPRRVGLAAALLLAAIGPATAAASTEGPCVPGDPLSPTCTYWDAQVTHVVDGDTLHVRVDGERGRQPVRISGIQAMELFVYGSELRAGGCHAVEAADRLQALVDAAGGRVRLAAQDPASRSRDRLRRSVAVPIGDRWVDAGRALLREGLALWLPGRYEWAWNARYSTYAEQAAAAEVGLWDDAACGWGPDEAHPIGLTVNGDGDRADDDTLAGPHGEWVRIANRDPVVPLVLDGWTLRDSDLRALRFPVGTVVAPGATLTVHVGAGIDTAGRLHWGLDHSVFDNPHREWESGDGAYLFDPDGDLRAHMAYPCRLACTDPNAGALELIVRPGGREEVGVRNLGPGPVALDAYRVSVRTHVYAFPVGTTLGPGETLRLITRRTPLRDEPLVKGWGKRGQALRNRGGAVRLSTFAGAVLACAAWGDGAC